MKYLNEVEKKILRKIIIENCWTVGTSRILKAFQDMEILSASRYLIDVGLFDRTYALGIMKEFFETDDYSLLSNVIVNANAGNEKKDTVFLRDILEESFLYTFFDFEINPDITFNYFGKLDSFLDELNLHLLAKQHFKIYLTTKESDLDELFKYQKTWRAELLSIIGCTNFGMIMKDIIRKYKYENFIKDLLSLSLCLKISWKYYFWFVHILNTEFLHQPHVVELFKDHMKDLFKKSIDHKNTQLFILMMATAKELSYANAEIYKFSKWYKNTIGDMNYYLKKPQFLIVLEHLNYIAKHENDEETLTLCINTYLSPPSQCNKLVLSFKDNCRMRLRKIKRTDDQDSANVTIILDDEQ